MSYQLDYTPRDGLLDYLVTAQALVVAQRGSNKPPAHPDWDHLLSAAGLVVTTVVMGSERPFDELRDAVMVYMLAAFERGREYGVFESGREGGRE